MTEKSLRTLALTLASALRSAADLIQSALDPVDAPSPVLAPIPASIPVPEPLPAPAPEPEPAPALETVRKGGRMPAAILSGQDWITLMTDRETGVAAVAMRHGANERTIIRLRQKALKGEVVASAKAKDIFAMLKDGMTPQEVSEALNVVLPTVQQANGLLNAAIVLRMRGYADRPLLPIAV